MGAWLICGQCVSPRPEIPRLGGVGGAQAPSLPRVSAWALQIGKAGAFARALPSPKPFSPW